MNFYDLTVNDAKGNPVKLSEYKGKTLLIVNTATGCGFTPQYSGLQELYDLYKDKDFEILDFPCNQFGNQAPGTNDEISTFCTSNYNTTFRLFAKIDVNGENESPLFTFLKGQKKRLVGSDIKWNFTKFLVDKDGNVVSRFAPFTTPASMKQEISKLLEK